MDGVEAQVLVHVKEGVQQIRVSGTDDAVGPQQVAVGDERVAVRWRRPLGDKILLNGKGQILTKSQRIRPDFGRCRLNGRSQNYGDDDQKHLYALPFLHVCLLDVDRINGIDRIPLSLRLTGNEKSCQSCLSRLIFRLIMAV